MEVITFEPGIPNKIPVMIDTINSAIIGLSFFMIKIRSRIIANSTTSNDIMND
jgi:hypothetical protein